MRRLLPSVLLLFIASGALVACGNDDPDTAPVATVAAGQELTVTGGRTTITLDPITAGVLTGAGVTVKPVDPANGSDTGLSLPVIGGEVTSGTFSGSVEHEGGIAFAAGNRRIAYVDLRADTVAQQVFAGAGDRTPLLDLDLRRMQVSEAGGAITASGVGATISAPAAEELNAGLKVSAFVPGQVIGQVTIRVTGS